MVSIPLRSRNDVCKMEIKSCTTLPSNSPTASDYTPRKIPGQEGALRSGPGLLPSSPRPPSFSISSSLLLSDQLYYFSSDIPHWLSASLILAQVFAKLTTPLLEWVFTKSSSFRTPSLTNVPRKPHPTALAPLALCYIFFQVLVTSSLNRFVHFLSSPLKHKLREGLHMPVFPGPKTGPDVNRSCK